MAKIKVLHIIKSLGRGGAEVLLPETLKMHNRNNFEFHYIYFLPWKDQMVGAIEKAGGKVTNFPASGNIELLRQYKKVARYCTENNIDLIHCHLPWSGFLGRLVHKKTGIPVVYTEHNLQERYHFITKKFNKFSFNFQSLAIGVSKDVSSSIKKNIHPEIPIHTIPNGVNTDYFRRNISYGAEIRKRYQIPENAIVIGNIAVFRKQKCLPNWIETVGNLINSHAEVYGLLVGAGPEEKEIKEMVEKRNLSGRIKLTGIQTDTIPYFSAMDIFMMSSAFEGLPVALLEAMSMGCAVASTRAGGVVEAIREGQDGLLTDVNDWEALTVAGEELILNTPKRREFQRSARERVKESFSLERMVNNLEEIYVTLKKTHVEEFQNELYQEENV